MNGEFQTVVPTIEGIDPRTGNYPDPVPFDIDGFFNEWNMTQSVERMPENKNNFSKIMYSFTKPFLAQGYNSLSALNRGTAGFYAHLDSVADFIEASGFGKKGGLFDEMARISAEKANYWKQRAEKVGIGFFDELISEAIGGFVPGVTQFSMDVASGFTFPYMEGAEEGAKKGEQPFIAGMLEAAKTGTLAAVFKMMSPLKKYLQAPTMGTIFGLQEMGEAPEGEKAKAFAKGAGIGIAYSLASPGGRLGLNEIKSNLEPELVKIAEANRKLGERGAIGAEPPKPGTKPRKFLKTVEEAAETAPELKEKLENLSEEAKSYDVKHLKEAIEKADIRIELEGIEKTLEYVLEKTSPTQEKTVVVNQLIKKLQKEGDYDRASNLVEEYSKQLTQAGQAIQAASMWNKLTPQGFIRWAEKELKKTESNYGWVDTIFGKKPENFTLSKDEKKQIFEKMTEINQMPEGIEKTDATLEMIDMVAKKVPPGLSEWLDAYRYQNMLSSPRTHMRNIGENILNTFMTRPIDLTTRGAYDWTKSILFGKEREAYVSDVPAYVKSSINAIPNALKAFTRTWSMESGTTIGKPEIGIEAKTEFQRARAKQMPSWLTIIPRFMEASDKFNSALIGAGEFEVQKRRGATDAEAYTRASVLAEKYLYRDKIDPKDKDLSYFSKVLESLGKTMEQTRKLPGLKTLSKWYVPFLRTPINKAVQMVEHSPLGLARSEFTPEAMSKIISGGIFTALGAIAAIEGETTWAPPSDSKEKELFYATGRKPFSVKIGEKWIPFWYLGPFALAFGIPAATKYYVHDQKHNLTKDAPEKLLETAEGIARFIGSQSSTQSIGSLFSALNGDIDFTLSSQTAFMVEQIIPGGSLIRFVNTIVDPVFRKPEGFWEQVEKDLPVLSKRLEERQTPLFETAEREAHNYFLPYDVGTTKEPYESLYPFMRYRVRNEALEQKVNELSRKVRKGEMKPEESMKEMMKLMEAVPKSLEQFGNEIKKQGENK